MPSVCRELIAEHLDQIDEIQRRIRPIDSELRPLAGADQRARLLQTSPGVGPLISLTFASEIGEVSRFSTPARLVGYTGRAPRIVRRALLTELLGSKEGLALLAFELESRYGE